MKTKILFLTLLLIGFVACKNSSSKNENTSDETQNTEQVISNSIDESSESTDESIIKGKNGFNIIVGESYEKYFKEGDYSRPSTRLYIQYKDFPKVEFPVQVVGSVYSELFEGMKSDFEDKYSKYRKSKDIVFEFYTEYADSGDIFLGVSNGNWLKIYSKVITQEDNSEAGFTISAEYEITDKGLKLVYKLDDSDYKSASMMQDFFQPITYTKEQIHKFIMKHAPLSPEVEGFDRIEYYDIFTKRFNDYLTYLWDTENPDINPEYIKEKEATFQGVFDLENYDFPYGTIYFIGDALDYQFTDDVKIKIDYENEKLDKYFYTATMLPKVFDSGKLIASNKQYIRIVQIDGVLYFDLFKDIQ